MSERDTANAGDGAATVGSRAAAPSARAGIVLVILGAGLVVALLAGLSWGAVPVGPDALVRSLGRLVTGAGSVTPVDALISEVRLPRVLLAALVGACLAVAGVLYQALFRNPLADPYILGVSSGAGLGATVALVIGSVLGVGLSAAWSVAVPVAAFVGALLTILLVAALAARRGGWTPARCCSPASRSPTRSRPSPAFLMVLYRQSMSAVVFWMMGGLQRRDAGATWASWRR